MTDISDLKRRVEQFFVLELPGQPPMMHMGTSSLVRDLWQVVKNGQERSSQSLKARLDTRLNDYLCTITPGYDDSITGFNEAWDIVRKFFDDLA